MNACDEDTFGGIRLPGRLLNYGFSGFFSDLLGIGWLNPTEWMRLVLFGANGILYSGVMGLCVVSFMVVLIAELSEGVSGLYQKLGSLPWIATKCLGVIG